MRNPISTSAPILDNSTTVTSSVTPTLTDMEVSPRVDYVDVLAVLTRRVRLLNQWEIDVAKAEMEALASILLNRPLSLITPRARCSTLPRSRFENIPLALFFRYGNQVFWLARKSDR
ncbi:43498aad-e2b6-4308-8fea-76afbfd1dc1d-CDS [Sclerotinia trifoliorum]|uniref:43498aad-e2b6-4308-8fea-76afbfd1dc1d-CDS n=1 Tax=Sclerotinia trifoliorum TaxID=28548 RepID=A0A8H2W075_9HELO|nr:43498aad-e2b6-4308-8fea-76afbfd1dc1d-CDS [Sclerotinia trifoliorum]